MMHDSPLAGHFGVAKTTELVKRDFYWKSMDKYIHDYVVSCDLCQRNKTARHKPYGLLQPLPIPNHPWKDIGMDFVGPLPLSKGFDMIYIVVCRLTKQAHFIPCKSNRTTSDVVDLFLLNIFKLHGLPNSIVSDRDSVFTSHQWLELVRLLNINHNLSTAYHQKSDGITERVIQTLKQFLRHFINYRQNDWIDYLSIAEFAYNNTHHSSIGMSPFMANYGYDFNLTFHTHIEGNVPSVGARLNMINKIHKELQTSLQFAAAIQKKYADKLLKEAPNFKVGESVWLLSTNIKTTRPNSSLEFKRLGPFKVLEQIGELNYKLKLPESMQQLHNVFHVSLLEKFYPNQIKERELVEVPPVIIDEQIEYEVNSILDSRVRRNQLEYLIDWKGYGIDERCWVKSREVHASELIKEFHKRNPNAKGVNDLRQKRKRGSNK
jgi:hypothetical protein